MLTTEQFEELEKRVAAGKKFLEGKWGDPKYKEWVSLWMDLSDQLFQEMGRRHVFTENTSIPTIEDAMIHFALIQEQAYQKGYIKKPRERRKKNDTSRSKGYSMFESS